MPGWLLNSKPTLTRCLMDVSCEAHEDALQWSHMTQREVPCCCCVAQRDAMLPHQGHGAATAVRCRTPIKLHASQRTLKMGALTPVDKCCCGCTLKTGSIVIGTLSAVNGAVALLVILQSSVNPHIGEYVNPYMLLVGALIALCQLITGFLLILGADKDCSKYVKPWLGFQCVKLLLDVMSSCAAVYYISHATVPVTGIVVIITTMLLGLVVEAYLMLVVYSFYKKLVNVDAKLPL